MSRVWPKSREELNQLLDEYEKGPHDYNTSADALWKAALAAFNYMSEKMGATGFQAGWAEMKFIQESKGIECPFIIIKLDDALYPQYNIPKRVNEFIEENKDWLKQEAIKNLEDTPEIIHPKVLKHWMKLAEQYDANKYNESIIRWNNWKEDVTADRPAD